MGVPPRSWEDTLEVIQDRSYLDEETGCFIWTGCVIGSIGYGSIRCEGKQYMLHKLIYKRLKSTIPVDAVRHSCDNPRCWNPEHLIGGSQKQNMEDKVNKGRHQHGQLCYNAALSEDTVRRIRQLPINDTELAKELGVTKTAVRHARIGRTWKHVKDLNND